MKTRIKQTSLGLCLGLIALLGVVEVSAQGGLLRQDRPNSYIVAEGDTLWNIASQFL